MRGKGEWFVLKNGNIRITPAYAGKSSSADRHLGVFWDHPRVCGEKFAFFVFAPDVLGSPPRMRGKVIQKVGTVCVSGITPAYAGKSWQALRSCQPQRDHPRVCGEKAALHVLHLAMLGSPPRMRGKGSARLSKGTSVGITPAYAGKRARSRTRRNPSKDHPRVCGEKRPR